MLPPENLVSELTQLVWSTMLRMDAYEGEPNGDAPTITTAVDIHGAWEGTVAISFPSGLARRLATALDEGAEPPSETEVSDALCEIVNMVGGNLKAMLPAPSSLSPPRLTASPSTVGGRTQWFACEGERFGVTINEGGGGRGDHEDPGG
ncbi:MAG: chemotaxis protein CheX [Deltaproteobacteria bacterium]|nr:chemotaxis protein CheX [Deltaproteobacteria bacterium]